METSTIIIIVIVGLLVLLAFYIIGVYNKLVNSRNKVDNQFSQIDIQLKRRADLIPNLVETVKGYAKHEEKTLTEVIDARNKAVSATSVNDKITANNEEEPSIVGTLFEYAEEFITDTNDFIPVGYNAFHTMYKLYGANSINRYLGVVGSLRSYCDKIITYYNDKAVNALGLVLNNIH